MLHVRPTIRDVAKLAGVSPGTVSRVLSPRESAVRISAATRERVMAATRELSYTPDPLASGLRSPRSRTIGLVVPTLTMAFPAAAISLLGTVLEQRGYQFLLAQARTEAEVQRFSRMYEQYRVSGLLFVGSSREVLDDAFLGEYCRRLNGHVVGLLSPPGPPLLVSVEVDNRRGIQLALDHLVGLGHERIAFVGPNRSWDFRQRFEAFRELVAAVAPKSTDPDLVQETPTASPRQGGEAMLRLLALPRPPSAVVFATDEMALVGLMAAHQAGFSAPGDVSVVGFDDIPWASYCWPPLTTVRQPVKPMVERAAECLLRLVENGRDEQIGRAYVFPPELVVRGSTAAPTSPSGRAARPPN